MFVHPDGSFETGKWQTPDLYPGSYFIDENTSEGELLANKVKENYPNYDLVIQNGILVDVSPKEPETPVDPEPVKSPEQLRIEQLERDNEQLMIAVADLYEQVLALQGGTA